MRDSNDSAIRFALSVLHKARLSRPVDSIRTKLLDNTIDYVIGIWPPNAYTLQSLAFQHVLNTYDWKDRLDA